MIFFVFGTGAEELVCGEELDTGALKEGLDELVYFTDVFEKSFNFKAELRVDIWTDVLLKTIGKIWEESNFFVKYGGLEKILV